MEHDTKERIHRRRRRRLTLWAQRLLLAGLILAAAVGLLGRLLPNAGQSPNGDPLFFPPENGGAPTALPDWVTRDLLPVNQWSRPGTPLDTVNGVVIHYVGNPNTTAQQNRSYFSNLADTHETYSSSHFIIGMDGAVLLCVPLDEVAYCSNQRNSDTIAIECCHPDDTGRFTDETYEALTQLTAWLMDVYGLEREDILRHYDVTGKECPLWFVEDETAWTEFLDQAENVAAALAEPSPSGQ